MNTRFSCDARKHPYSDKQDGQGHTVWLIIWWDVYWGRSFGHYNNSILMYTLCRFVISHALHDDDMIFKCFLHYRCFVRESNSHLWIFVAKGNWCIDLMFLLCSPEQTFPQRVQLSVNWDAWCSCDGPVMHKIPVATELYSQHQWLISTWRSILMCNKSTFAGTSLEGTPMFAHVTLHRTFNPLGSKCPWWQYVEAAF